MNRSGARRVVALLGVAAVVLGLGAPVSADGSTLAPVENLAAETSIGSFTLTWTDPGNVDADGFLVCGHPGSTPLAGPTQYCGDDEDDYQTSTSYMAGFPPWQTWTFSVWPRDTHGDLGPARSVTLVGTVTTMSTVPSTDAARTGIRLAGQLTDGGTGAPLAGQVVDVYADRPALTPQPDGFSDEFVRVARFTTDADGRFARTFPLRPGWDYQARYFGQGTRMGNLSKLFPADGSSFIGFESRDASMLRSRSRTITLVAEVPAVRRGDRVVFQRLRRGHWRQVAVRSLGGSRTSTLRPRVARHTKPVFRAVLLSARRKAQPSVPLVVRRH